MARRIATLFMALKACRLAPCNEIASSESAGRGALRKLKVRERLDVKPEEFIGSPVT